MRAALALVYLTTALTATAHAQRPGWEVRIPERVEAAGDAGSLPIAIAVDRGLVVSKDAPIVIDLKAPDAVAFKKRRLARPDAVDPDADAQRFVAPFKSLVAGEHAVQIRLSFWLCGRRSCRPVSLTRRVIVAVPEPSGHQQP